MDRAEFSARLARYRKVRGSDTVLPVDYTPPHELTTATSSASSVASPESHRPKKRVADRDTEAKDGTAAPLPVVTSYSFSAPATGTAGAGASSRADTSPPEFWASLQALLEAHIATEAGRKAVQRKFDELHFSFANSLSLEDLEDVVAALDREEEAL